MPIHEQLKATLSLIFLPMEPLYKASNKNSQLYRTLYVENRAFDELHIKPHIKLYKRIQLGKIVGLKSSSLKGINQKSLLLFMLPKFMSSTMVCQNN